MKINTISKILFIILSFILSMYGIFFLDWNISILYFWFFIGYIFEFFFTYFRLRIFWKNFDYPRKASDRQGFFIIGIVGFVLISIFFTATLQSLQISRSQLFDIFINQRYLILLLFIAFAGLFYSDVVNKFFMNPDFNFHTKRFNSKLMILSIIYILSIFRFHAFSDSRIEFSRTYLLFLGIALIAGEALAETFIDYLGKKKTIHQ